MWLTRASRAKGNEGHELRLYNDGAKDGVHTAGSQSLQSGLLPLELAMAKDFTHYLAKHNLFNLRVELFHFNWAARLSRLCVYPLHTSAGATKAGGDH